MASELPSPSRGLVVFSGGTAANNLVDVFNEVASRRRCSLQYLIPISDNGGSSSELIRVFGGPGIGDIRSRLVRLIPPSQVEIRALLNHRLPPDPVLASEDWQDIVAGTSLLWQPIHSGARELLRSMLNHVNMEILKRARPPHSTFNFSSASVGNLFLTGARLFTGSFESAIYLLALVCGISDHTAVIPAINSNFSHHISAGLANGDVITGQNAISHPSEPSALAGHTSSDGSAQNDAPGTTESEKPGSDGAEPLAEDAHLPGTLASLRTPNIHFTKPSATSLASRETGQKVASLSLSEQTEGAPVQSCSTHNDLALPAPIDRIWYINPYGQEMHPRANPKALAAICSSSAVIYSIGSLYTSIIPSLILRGVGSALVSNNGPRRKVLVLNGSADRETAGMGAADYVGAIARAGEESREWRASSTHAGGFRRDVECALWKNYVTHVIFMEGEGVPNTDRAELEQAGIDCVRCWGKRGDDGVWRYDAQGLTGALEAALGKGLESSKSRRNTLES